MSRKEDARLFVDGQNFFAPILFRESVLDSVSFRAHARHFDEQIDALDAWLGKLVRGTRDFMAQFGRLEEQAVELSRHPPAFIEGGVVDPDFTFVAMSRFAEANRAYWIEVFAHARLMEQTVTEPVVRLQQTELKEIKHLRSEFYRTQKAYDEQLRHYAGQPRTKEASALREEAFQLFERRKVYTKSSFDYVIKMSMFRASVDKALVQGFVRGFNSTIHHANALASDQNARPRMDNVMDWMAEMSRTARGAEEYLHAVRFELEDEVVRLATPPRDLSEYQPPRKTLPAPGGNSRQGWLLMRAVTGKPARYIWHRRWFYISRNGLFGWLTNNHKTGAVEESERIGVLLCNVRPSTADDRRHCFEVVTKDTTIVLQAETDGDVQKWLGVFESVKKAVLARGATDQASTVTRPATAFASGQHTEERGHAKADSGHGLTALISATSGVTMMGTFGAAGTNLMPKLSNPFETPIELYPLAPTTLAPSPICTALTTQPTGDAGGEGPSAPQANFWGSVAYGLAQSGKELSAPEMAKMLTAPESVLSNIWQRRAVMGASGKEYPPELPPELRRQDAHFMALFPHARAEHVLMVLRASRAVPGHAGSFGGRLYFTLRACYFYCNQAGMVIAQTCPYSEILGVRVQRGSTYDELALDVHELGRASVALYLDDGNFAKKRIEILLGNYIADEPHGPAAVFRQLRDALPADTRMRSTSAPTAPVEENDEEEDDDNDAGKRVTKIDGVRLRLPSEPVAGEPDEQMLGKVYDAEYMVTAKGLFHLLFGNRSPIWLRTYADMGFSRVQQGPWQTIEDGTLARAFRYELELRHPSGRLQTSEWADFHKIWRRDEHLNYVVTFYRKPYDYPGGEHFFLHIKWNITYVSKRKARLRAWMGVDWQDTNRLLRGVIARDFHRSIGGRVMPTVRQFIEREALHRLGLQSKTSKAVRLYGRVTGQADSMYLEGRREHKGNPRQTRMSALQLVRKHPRVFVESLVGEGWTAASAAYSALVSFVTAHGLLLAILLVSALTNLYLSGRVATGYWRARAAADLLDRGPIPLVTHGVTLDGIEALVLPTPVSDCVKSFDAGRGTLSAERRRISRRRHDLLVALRLLNRVEGETVRADWERFALSHDDCAATDATCLDCRDQAVRILNGSMPRCE